MTGPAAGPVTMHRVVLFLRQNSALRRSGCTVPTALLRCGAAHDALHHGVGELQDALGSNASDAV